MAARRLGEMAARVGSSTCMPIHAHACTCMHIHAWLGEKRGASPRASRRVAHGTCMHIHAHACMHACMAGKKELTAGFEAWAAGHAEQSRRQRMVVSSAARLSKPMLMHCYSHWRHDWGRERVAASKMSLTSYLLPPTSYLLPPTSYLLQVAASKMSLRERMAAEKAKALEAQVGSPAH